MSPLAPMHQLTIPLRRDGTTAVLNAPNPLTKKDVANLKAWLTWYETSMLDDDTVETSSSSSAALAPKEEG
jgi:hypothetical protein